MISPDVIWQTLGIAGVFGAFVGAISSMGDDVSATRWGWVAACLVYSAGLLVAGLVVWIALHVKVQ
jgi:hypothetical protein